MSEDLTLKGAYTGFKSLLKQWWFWVLLILVMIRLCSLNENENVQKNNENIAIAQTQEESPPPRNTPPMPADEVSFNAIIQSAQSESSTTQNDMQKGGIKAIRDKAICKLIKKLKVKNWVGEIVKITANSDGKGIIELAVAKNITVKTWNNDLSDWDDHSLLSPESKVFKAASSMNTGDMVHFTGSFIAGTGGECVKEGSLTLTGKLAEPEFIFKFSNIEAINLSSEEPTQVNTLLNPSSSQPAIKNDTRRIKMTATFEDIPTPQRPNGNKVFVRFHNVFNAPLEKETKTLMAEIKKWLTSKGYQAVNKSTQANTIIDIELFQNEERIPTTTLTMTMYLQRNDSPLIKMSSGKFSITGYELDIFSNSRTAKIVTDASFSRSPLRLPTRMEN